MADRFLEVDITKVLGSTLYLKVDDEDPRFSALLESGETELEKLRSGVSLLNQVRKSAGIANAVKETIQSTDWEDAWNPTDSDFDVEGVKEVAADEALMYAVFDVKTGKIADE